MILFVSAGNGVQESGKVEQGLGLGLGVGTWATWPWFWVMFDDNGWAGVLFYHFISKVFSRRSKKNLRLYEPYCTASHMSWIFLRLAISFLAKHVRTATRTGDTSLPDLTGGTRNQ